MKINTDDIFVGIAWDPSKAEEYAEQVDREDDDFALPIVILGTEAEDEHDALEVWRHAHPDLEISTVFPLTTLVESGAVS
jgi:hypothetical protein